MEDPPAFLSTRTASTTTTRGQRCQGGCRGRFSSDTWDASATGSSSCWELLAIELLCCSFGTFTEPSSASKLRLHCG